MLTFATAPELLKPRQVQELLQISRTTFFRMAQAGTLAGAFKINRDWRVKREVLKAWVDEQ